jgi:dTDP-4-dehydrorhamnose 3,5-epimerase
MKVRTFHIDGPLLVEPRRFHDLRGFFAETFNAMELAKHGVEAEFTLDNVTLSTASGTVRGLHFQRPPIAQSTLIRVIRGAIFDVAVDLRAGSPTYGKHVGVELTAENALQLFIPSGFAHGYATLRPLTEISCKVTAPASADHEEGIFWDDPALRIRWPVTSDDAILSPADSALPLLREIETPFEQETSQSGVAA